MKYYRLTFKSQDRLTGSSFNQPKFVIDMPSNTFGNTRSGECYVHLESFDGYGSKQSSKAYDQVLLSFKNFVSMNSIETNGEGNGNFINSQLIQIIKADRRGSSEIHYHFERDNKAIENSLIYPSASFSNNQIQFDLEHLDQTPFQSAGSEFDFYIFSIGVYVKTEDCECK